MPDTISCTFYRDAHDNLGRRVETTWDRLIERLSRHDVGTKDGPALTCATFNTGQDRWGKAVTRRNDLLVARSMVALDIETSKTTGEVPITFDAMADYLAVRRVRAACWTTHSHTLSEPRYRILLPLDAALPYDLMTDAFLSAAAAAQLRCYGVSDPSKFGAASLFFLPRHASDAPHAWRIVDGEPVDSGMLLTMATTMAEKVAQDEAEIAARRQRNALPPAITAKIEAYNAEHPIAERLAAYGYRREGNRWKSPLQHGQGATVILPEGKRWVSFSQSDADSNVGARPLRSSSQATAFGDAFQLFVTWEHRGSFRSALASLPDNGADHAAS